MRLLTRLELRSLALETLTSRRTYQCPATPATTRYTCLEMRSLALQTLTSRHTNPPTDEEYAKSLKGGQQKRWIIAEEQVGSPGNARASLAPPHLQAPQRPLQLEGRYTKWNNNGGSVRPRPVTANALAAIREEDEEEEDEEDEAAPRGADVDAPIIADDVIQVRLWPAWNCAITAVPPHIQAHQPSPFDVIQVRPLTRLEMPCRLNHQDTPTPLQRRPSGALLLVRLEVTTPLPSRHADPPP